MDLKNKTLEFWLKDAPISKYPLRKKREYYSQYSNLKTYLDKHVHNKVNIGAKLKNRGLLLNDHGKDHVQMVIEKASTLLQNSDCELTPKECYMLLTAIQFHDVGNIFGRNNHELNTEKIWEEVKNIVSDDTTEIKIINDIARAHGGKIKNDKNTIGKLLQIEDSVLSEKIRPQLLAAILRLSDEIADDKTRSFLSNPKDKKIEIPDKSMIFHLYSLALDSVMVNRNEKSIELHFTINKDQTQKKYGKYKSENIFIIDEIYIRTIKLYTEMNYCMKFMKKNFDFEKVNVKIDFYSLPFSTILNPITFELKDDGYPHHSNNIFNICPELTYKGKKMNGSYIRKQILKKG